MTMENSESILSPGTAQCEGLVGPYARMYFLGPDGAQMQDKWLNTVLKVCLYWPDCLALPL